MYQVITNPETGRQVSIYGKIGKNVLQKYVSLMNGGAATWGAEDQAEAVLKRQNKLKKIECSSVFNLSNEEVREMLGNVKEKYEDDGGDPDLMKSIIEQHGNDCVFLMALIKITADAKILFYLDKDHDLRTNKNLILELILYDARTINAVSIDESWEKDVNTIKELFNRIYYDPDKEEFYIKVDNGVSGGKFFPNKSSDQPKFTEAELAEVNYANFLNNKDDLNTHYVIPRKKKEENIILYLLRVKAEAEAKKAATLKTKKPGRRNIFFRST